MVVSGGASGEPQHEAAHGAHLKTSRHIAVAEQEGERPSRPPFTRVELSATDDARRKLHLHHVAGTRFVAAARVLWAGDQVDLYPVRRHAECSGGRLRLRHRRKRPELRHV